MPFFEDDFKLLQCEIKIVLKVRGSVLVRVFIPQHLYATACIVKDMANHPKLPEPF